MFESRTSTIELPIKVLQSSGGSGSLRKDSFTPFLISGEGSTVNDPNSNEGRAKHQITVGGNDLE